ncbi:LamG-like jellyroll fold domain-containing protein [Nocardioides sp. YIM 152588]|uniref:LamG-like jellyroll fold domain-containing protein n=1 Tax=Nocardioides sp. YIM 152588 TaxID=3158259 RepID=UPI0032E4A264
MLVFGGTLAACGGDEEPRAEPTPQASSTTPAQVDPAAALWLTFDESSVDIEGETIYRDAAGSTREGRVVTARGGEVTEVDGADGAGGAVAFPPPCDGGACPRALIEVGDAPALDPGEEPFSFGVSVWLAPDETTTGSNIVQKGRFGTEGGQWKLQVDDLEGTPSCVVRSGATMLKVHSDVSIADSAWHRVVCSRDADGIGIDVDGVVERTEGATGEVSSEYPIRIGSPGVHPTDDQFHGRVDDVFLLVGE